MGKSILIVDDSTVSRQITKKYLPPGDYTIREADSGRKCLSLYEEQKADIVFLDLTMPDMDGFETLSRLKKLDPQINVVIVTADVQSHSAEKALAIGAIRVVHKPANSDDLKAAMEACLP